MRLLAIAAIALFYASAANALEAVEKRGDEIIVCGRSYRIGTPVVTWMDEGGYDNYRVELRFAPWINSSWEASSHKNPELETPNRYDIRDDGTESSAFFERVRGGGWSLEQLRSKTNKIILHYDAKGFSRRAFETLHDADGESTHFLIDVDGTIYQTLDVKEAARHVKPGTQTATIANMQGIGVHLANIGAFREGDPNPFDEYYDREPETNLTRLIVPAEEKAWIRTEGVPFFPARDERVFGTVQGVELVQVDFTQPQYDALARLCAALIELFPGIEPNYPRNEDGSVHQFALPPNTLQAFSGIVANFHVETRHLDPGPALDWEWLLDEVERIMEEDENPEKLHPGIIVGIVLGGLLIAGALVYAVVSAWRNGCDCERCESCSCPCSCSNCACPKCSCECCERESSKDKKASAKATDEARKFARLHSIKYDATMRLSSGPNSSGTPRSSLSKLGSTSNAAAPRSQTFSPRQPLRR